MALWRNFSKARAISPISSLRLRSAISISRSPPANLSIAPFRLPIRPAMLRATKNVIPAASSMMASPMLPADLTA